MKFKKSYWSLSLLLIHLLIALAAFTYFFKKPTDSVFCTYGDGLKNYYTLQSYVAAPITNEGIFKYDHFAYPYGDYVYYTDNTPFFSIPFRWFCHHVKDISAYTIPAFHLFIIGNIILCGLLAFWVFRKLTGNRWLSFILAIVLPWANMQLLRIWHGHFNLSITSLSVAAIALFILWYENRGNTRKVLFFSVLMSLLAVAAFLVHGYFVVIITGFLTGMAFFYGLLTRKKEGGKLMLSTSLLIPALALGLIFLLLAVTDKYLPFRKENAMGYDWMEQKTIYSKLFSHYDFHSVFFPLYSSKDPWSLEIASYLGNIGLFTLGIAFIMALFSSAFRRLFLEVQRDYFRDPARKAIFWAGMLMLSMSFGEKYYPIRDKAILSLPFNPDLLFTKTILVYGLLLAAIITLLALSNDNRPPHLIPAATHRQQLKKQLLVTLGAGLLLFLFVGRYTLTLTNIFNPLWYLHFVTKRVEQFRSIARFNWPFFWTFYVWIAYTLTLLLQRSGYYARRALVLVIILLGMAEVRDFVKEIRVKTSKENMFAKVHISHLQPPHVNFSDYQAILPIPFYFLGSEDYAHTLNDNDNFSTYTMQLGLNSHLPLMAEKLSRTPPEYGIQILNMVGNDQIHPDLKKRLNSKPILIVTDRQLMRDSTLGTIPNAKDYPEAYALYWKSIEFIERHHLQPVDSLGNNFFYSWQPQ
jgi:hypothetical protein